MKKVLFVSKTRGFFNHLFNTELNGWMISSLNNSYEKFTMKKKILSLVGRSTILDIIGYIHTIKTVTNKADIYATYNRFLEADVPYIIYLENPTALFHYKLKRYSTKMGKRNLTKLINDKNLKAVICMSEACREGFIKLYEPIIERDNLIIEQIYPLITEEKLQIDTQHNDNKKFSLLFIAQGKGFISKGGIEVVNTFIQLEKKIKNIELNIITSSNDIPPNILLKINNSENINLIEFGISYDELKKYYIESNVLIHLTRQDSFGLTILEAMKYGTPVITTKLYSIPELIKENKNGYLTEPSYWFFNQENLPNPAVWNNRRNTIFSKKSDKSKEKFLYDKIIYLYENREDYNQLKDTAYRNSKEKPFSEEFIINKWENLLNKIEMRKEK